MTIRFDLSAQSTLVTSLSYCFGISKGQKEGIRARYVGKGFGFCEALALFGVNVDVVTVGTDGYFGPIGIERKGGDRSNMELIDLRGRHGLRQDGKAVDCRTLSTCVTGSIQVID